MGVMNAAQDRRRDCHRVADKIVSDLPQRRLAAAEGGYVRRRQSRPNDDGVAGHPYRCVVESCGREIGLDARYVGTTPVPAAAAMLTTGTAGTIVAGTVVVPRAIISRAIVPRAIVPRTVIAGTIIAGTIIPGRP